MKKRIGELDCLVCALQVLSGSEWTMRDAHVWLYWAGMTDVKPQGPTNAHWRAVSEG